MFQLSKMQRLLLGLVLAGVVTANNYLDGDGENSEPTTCPCGWGVKERIVGGKESNPNAYPFMVALAFITDGRPFCGATVLTRKHAVTAAHCTYDIKNKINDMRLLVGAHDIRRASNEQFIPVLRTIEHPHYDPDDNEAHDIAIVELARNLVYRRDVGPACLPNKRVNLENRNVMVTGWGLTKHEGRTSKVLREVVLKVLPWENCNKYYPGELQKTRTQICTYGKNKDSCQGDSGGPLTVVDARTSKFYIVGLISFGRECASENPAVNTDISSYKDWIDRVISQTSNGSMHTCTKKE